MPARCDSFQEIGFASVLMHRGFLIFMSSSETRTPPTDRRRRGRRAVPPTAAPGSPTQATAARTPRNSRRGAPRQRVDQPPGPPTPVEPLRLAVDGSALTPRITRAPKGLGDIFDRQLTRATGEEDHERYMTLLKFARSTLVMLALAFAVAGGVMTVGIAAAVHFAGMPLAAALGLGVLGGSSSVVLGSMWLRKFLGTTLAHLKPVSDTSAKNPPAPDADADRAP